MFITWILQEIIIFAEMPILEFSVTTCIIINLQDFFEDLNEAYIVTILTPNLIMIKIIVNYNARAWRLKIVILKLTNTEIDVVLMIMEKVSKYVVHSKVRNYELHLWKRDMNLRTNTGKFSICYCIPIFSYVWWN